MFNWLLSEKHAMTILRKDHDGVKAIFDEFKKAESPAKRKALIRQAALVRRRARTGAHASGH